MIKHRGEGYLYPYWTVQAYVDRPGGRLLSVGIAKTVELYLYIEQREREGPPLKRKRSHNGGEEFLILEWKEYLRSGRYCFLYRKDSV